jgi:hypothetical protein
MTKGKANLGNKPNLGVPSSRNRAGFQTNLDGSRKFGDEESDTLELLWVWQGGKDQWIPKFVSRHNTMQDLISFAEALQVPYVSVILDAESQEPPKAPTGHYPFEPLVALSWGNGMFPQILEGKA